MTSKVIGKLEYVALGAVSPNDWNPNRLTPRQYESLKHGLATDGWITSQALLVWGTDESGVARNVIIDGEHRWRAAGDLGYEDVPVVYLNGITELAAKALTIKLDAKRGQFDQDKLGGLVGELMGTLGSADLALDLGFTDGEIAQMMSGEEVVIVDDSPAPVLPKAKDETPSPTSHTSENNVAKQVPLYMDVAEHARFTENVQALMKRYDVPNVSDAVQRAVREVWETL